MKTVWKYTAAGRREKRHGKHPTQKPVSLIERCIRASTAPDDLVLDPFSGTPSTGVAALNMGRRFVGIEVEQEFVDIGLQRLQNFEPDPRNPDEFDDGGVLMTIRVQKPPLPNGGCWTRERAEQCPQGTRAPVR